MDNSDLCKSFEKCGGCSYRGVKYEEQLKFKEEEIRNLLINSGFDSSLLIDIKPSPCISHYRNKMEYTFGDEFKDGPMHLGLHEKGKFMNIIDVSDCRLVHADFNLIIDAVLNFCLDKGYKHFNRKTHEGLLRNLILRRGVRTKEIIINIVTSSGEFDEQGFIELIISLNLENTVVGILHTICNGVSDAVVPEEIKVLHGREYYNEIIMGLSFKVGPFSFFQTNVEAAERLYKDAISLISDLDNKTVFDLYCGTGTISQAVATKAKKVVGVEIVEEAIETAKESAKINGLENCVFIAEDVNKALDKIEEKPDVIIVDPPRSGIIPKAMDKILAYGVNEIVYISCNPKTLMPNLVQATQKGYKIKQLVAYDNFSYTRHVESVCHMSMANFNNEVITNA